MHILKQCSHIARDVPTISGRALGRHLLVDSRPCDSITYKCMQVESLFPEWRCVVHPIAFLDSLLHRSFSLLGVCEQTMPAGDGMIGLLGSSLE